MYEDVKYMKNIKETISEQLNCVKYRNNLFLVLKFLFNFSMGFFVVVIVVVIHFMFFFTLLYASTRCFYCSVSLTLPLFSVSISIDFAIYINYEKCVLHTTWECSGAEAGLLVSIIIERINRNTWKPIAWNTNEDDFRHIWWVSFHNTLKCNDIWWGM